MTTYDLVRALILDIPTPKTKEGLVVLLDIINAAIERDKGQLTGNNEQLTAEEKGKREITTEELQSLSTADSGREGAGTVTASNEGESIPPGAARQPAGKEPTGTTGATPPSKPGETAAKRAPNVEAAADKRRISARLDAYKLEHPTSYAAFLAKQSGGKLTETDVKAMGTHLPVAIAKWRELDAVLERAGND